MRISKITFDADRVSANVEGFDLWYKIAGAIPSAAKPDLGSALLCAALLPAMRRRQSRLTVDIEQAGRQLEDVVPDGMAILPDQHHLIGVVECDYSHRTRMLDDLLAIRAPDDTRAKMRAFVAHEREALKVEDGKLLDAGSEAEHLLRRLAHLVLSLPEAQLE